MKCHHCGGTGQEPEPPSPPFPGRWPAGFEAFWALYPRHTAKQNAVRAWTRLRPSEELRGVIHRAITAQKQSEEWKRGVIPHASTWLNGHRWEDETRPVVAPKAVNGAPFPPAQLWQPPVWMVDNSFGTRFQSACDRAAEKSEAAGTTEDDGW